MTARKPKREGMVCDGSLRIGPRKSSRKPTPAERVFRALTKVRSYLVGQPMVKVDPWATRAEILSVPRDDRCGQCGTPMIYHVDERGVPTEMFCGTFGCPAWLLEMEVPDAR